MIRDTDKILHNIAVHTAGRTPVYPEEQKRGTSAVLVPLIRDEKDGFRLLYERRASTLDKQPGEICFPGGRIEMGETISEAAARETREELLIGDDQIHILGRMNGVMGPTGAPVWPVIAEITGYSGTYSTDEVSDVFTISVDWFREHPAEGHDLVLKTVPADDFPYELIPGGRAYPFAEKHSRMYFYRLPDRVIWGLTAHVTDQFMRLI